MKRTGRVGKSCAALGIDASATIVTAASSVSERIGLARMAVSPSRKTRSRARRHRWHCLFAETEYQSAVTLDPIVDADRTKRLPVVGMGAGHHRNSERALDQRC